MIASAVSDFPLPDSPISPTRAPGASSKLDAVDEETPVELDREIADGQEGVVIRVAAADRARRAARRRAG